MHNNNALIIIDEVQTGFGRIGNTFWAHQLYENEFIPDIVTIGKSMGNGFPVSAVVTRKEIADKLDGDVAYFNTVKFFYLFLHYIYILYYIINLVWWKSSSVCSCIRSNECN